MRLNADDDFWLDDCARKKKEKKCCFKLVVEKLCEKLFFKKKE